MKLKEEYIDGLVSVIIPCYNGAEYLSSCVKSILNNDYKNIEIIIVDDGSTDNSWDICCSLSKSHKEIQLYQIKNSGVSAARNIGTEHAAGEFITYVDADDELFPNAISALLNAMSKHGVDCSSGKRFITRRNGKIPMSPVNPEDCFSCVDHTSQMVCITGYLFHRNLLTKAVEFPEGIAYSEDFYWGNMLFAFLEKGIARVDECVYIYYVGSTQAMHAVRQSNAFYIQKQAELLDYIESKLKSGLTSNTPPKIVAQFILVRRLIINATYGDAYHRNVVDCHLPVTGKRFLSPDFIWRLPLPIKSRMIEWGIWLFPLLESYRLFTLLMRIRDLFRNILNKVRG